MVSQLLGGAGSSVLTQIVLYQVIGQLVGGALEPYFRALGYKVNERTPNAELTPAELAALVERTFWTESAGAAAAAKFGINPDRFADLVRLQTVSPPPEFLAVALRRGIIPDDDGDPDGVSFHAGIAQGAIGTKWEDVIRRMAVALPTPQLALDGALEGQIAAGSDAERLAIARDLYQKFGGDPDYFELEYNTRGAAPTPVQAGELAKRGIIPWTGSGPGVVSYEQAFLEGPWRNKWLEPMQALADYIPPPRTVTAMVRDGSLTDEQAVGYFQAYGMTPQLAAAYLKSAHREKTAGSHELTRSTIEALYRDRVLTRADAIAMLKAEGYSDRDADYLLQVVDLAEQQRTVTAVTTRIRTLYASYKLTRNAAVQSLQTLGHTPEGVADLMELWDLQREASPRELTPAQIEGAHFYKIISQDEAQSLLVQLGYTPHDAWIALSVRSHKALPGEPPRSAVGNAPGIVT